MTNHVRSCASFALTGLLFMAGSTFAGDEDHWNTIPKGASVFFAKKIPFPGSERPYLGKLDGKGSYCALAASGTFQKETGSIPEGTLYSVVNQLYNEWTVYLILAETSADNRLTIYCSNNSPSLTGAVGNVKTMLAQSGIYLDHQSYEATWKMTKNWREASKRPHDQQPWTELKRESTLEITAPFVVLSGSKETAIGSQGETQCKLITTGKYSPEKDSYIDVGKTCVIRDILVHPITLSLLLEGNRKTGEYLGITCTIRGGDLLENLRITTVGDVKNILRQRGILLDEDRRALDGNVPAEKTLKPYEF